MNDEHIYEKQLKARHGYLLKDKPKRKYKFFKGEKKCSKSGRNIKKI